MGKISRSFTLLAHHMKAVDELAKRQYYGNRSMALRKIIDWYIKEGKWETNVEPSDT